MAVGIAKRFLRDMAQPFKADVQEGISTWSLKDLEAHKERMEEESIRALREAQANGVDVNGEGANENANGNGGMQVDPDDYGIDEDDEAAMMELDG